MLTCGFSSTLTFPTLTFPAYSFDNSSITGPIARQGPHHSAQKSTTVNLSELKTSFWKFESVNAFAILFILNSQRYIESANLTPTTISTHSCHKLVKLAVGYVHIFCLFRNYQNAERYPHVTCTSISGLF